MNIQNILEKAKTFDIKELINKYQISLIVFLIFLTAIFLRFWNIELIPGGFSEQEDSTVRTIASLTRENMWLAGGYYNAAYIYIAYLWANIFELSINSLRYLSATIGSATVILSYFFIKNWFSRKISIFMTLLFSFSSFHIAASRLILPEILLPFILLLSFIVTTYAYRTKNIWLFGFSGMLFGLGFYTSPAFLLIPLVLIFSGWYFFVKNKKFILGYKQELSVALAGFGAVIIPYIVSFYNNPGAYLDYYNFSTSLQGFAINISQLSAILFSSGSQNYLYNIRAEPLFDPFIFVTAIGGILFAIISIQRRKYLFIILWFFFLSVYASIRPNLTGIDLLGLIPVIYVFSALIIDYILDRWFETFPKNKKAKIIIVATISIFFALSMTYNYEKYFVAFKHSEGVKKEFSKEPPIKID